MCVCVCVCVCIRASQNFCKILVFPDVFAEGVTVTNPTVQGCTELHARFASMV